MLNEDTFGPIAIFMSDDDGDELTVLLNDTDLGPTASLWTYDLSKALQAIPKVQAGTVGRHACPHSFDGRRPPTGRSVFPPSVRRGEGCCC